MQAQLSSTLEFCTAAVTVALSLNPRMSESEELTQATFLAENFD